MADLPSVKMKKRANIVVMMGILIFAAVAAANLFKIMVINSEEYQDMADSSQFGATPIPANRGTIYSSDGKILAQSATVFRIIIDPIKFNEYNIDKKDMVINFLSGKLDISNEKILHALEQDSKYEILAKQVEMPVKDEILKFVKDNDITSATIYAEEDTKRYYPQDNLAASVVGFLNADGDGQYGVEKKYDEYLSGVDGVTISAQDAFGDQMPYRYSKLYEAKDGNSVHLTIDTMIQYYAESALNSAVEKFDAAENGCAIVMNVKTGAILAMYTAPGFDLNNKGVLPEEGQLLVESGKAKEIDLLEKMWKNKAISTISEPGSVFKVFTSSAALEEKVVSFDSTFECKGYYEVLGERINCHATSGHPGLPILTFKDALANSCNPSFIQIGLALGGEKFSYYADAFGLREKTGIDLPGEVNSYFASHDVLVDNEFDLAQSSYGQKNTLTPIQIMTGYAAAINGGYLLQPYVVQKIVDGDQNVVKETERNVKRQVISEETSGLMREALQNNVDSKTAGNAYISGYKIGGKSGTAEKLATYQAAKQEYEELKKNDPKEAAAIGPPVSSDYYVASYCAFAPADDPEIIVYVMVDEPRSISYFGSAVAAPCVRSIMENTLPYLGYYPEYTEEEQLTMDIRIPDVEDMEISEAVNELEKAGFKPDIRGEGQSVVSQIPSFTSSMPAGGNIILYTEAGYEQKDIIMPDLKNMKIADVNKKFGELGLNLKVTGSQSENAIVLEQSVMENTIVKEGTIVTVHFGVNDQTG